MDRTDDEINIIEAGRNYGWDQVSGYCDGNVDGYRIGQNTSADEENFCNNTAAQEENRSLRCSPLLRRRWRP